MTEEHGQTMPIPEIKFHTGPRSFLNKTFLIPALILILFAAWRLAVFSLTHPVFFRDDFHEACRAAVARELLHGTTLSLWDYRVDNYAGGFYIIALLLPFFQSLLGFSMFSIKAFAIAQTGCTLLLWYIILARYANRRTAVIFSALYIFAPFRYISLSSMVLGDHAETCLLSALTVYLFFRLRKFTPREHPGPYLAAGLLAGFSLWFAYIYAVTLAAIFFFGIANYGLKIPHPKIVALGCAGAFIGLSFWIGFNLHQGFSGFIINDTYVWSLFHIENLWKPFLSWRELFLFKLLNNPEAPDLWHPAYNIILILYVLTFSFIAGAIILRYFKLRGNKFKTFRESPAGLGVIYIFCFFVIQQMFDSVGLRFLLPLFPFALAVIASGLAEISQKKFLLAFAGTGTLIALAAACTCLRFAPQHFGDYLSEKGYSVKALTHVSGIRPRIERAFSEKNFSSLRRSDKIDYIAAFVEELKLDEPTAVQEILNSARMIPEDYQGFYAYFAGRELMVRSLDLVKTIRRLEPLRSQHPFFFQQMTRAAFAVIMNLESYEPEIEDLKKNLPPDLVHKLAAYEGFKFTEKIFLNNADFESYSEMLQTKIKDFNPDRKERFLRGAARFVFRKWFKDPPHAPVTPLDLKKFPEDIQAALFRGIAAQILRKHIVYYRSPLVWTWNEFHRDLDQNAQEKLVAGLRFAMARWELPENSLPLEKLAGFSDSVKRNAEFHTKD